jgi:hypothetical protein
MDLPLEPITYAQKSCCDAIKDQFDTITRYECCSAAKLLIYKEEAGLLDFVAN